MSGRKRATITKKKRIFLSSAFVRLGVPVRFFASSSFSSLHLIGVHFLVRMTDLSDVCFVEFYSFVFRCLHHQYVFSIYANFEAENRTHNNSEQNCGDLLRSSVYNNTS